jgi:hypothetical protein
VPGLGLFIESRYSTNKLRSVGKIEIVCPASEARFDDPIGRISISLKRPGGVNYDVRGELPELSVDIGISLESNRNPLRPTRQSCTKLLGFPQ